jgi:hypothetical protein
MANHWYFQWNDNRLGPFTTAELRELARLGRLQPTDMVWKEGIEKGALATKVKGLFAILPAKADPGNGTAPVPMSRQPSTSGSEVIANAVEKSNPLTKGQVTPDAQLHGIIPDGLMLRPIAGQDDSILLPSPWTKSPGPA